MKKYQIIILLISIAYICSRCEKENPSKKSECHDAYTDEDRNNGKYCCYIEVKKDGKEEKFCEDYTKEEKDNIENTIKEIEKDGLDVKSLDCKSSYLSISLFSLIFLLF